MQKKNPPNKSLLFTLEKVISCHECFLLNFFKLASDPQGNKPKNWVTVLHKCIIICPNSKSRNIVMQNVGQ